MRQERRELQLIELPPRSGEVRARQGGAREEREYLNNRQNIWVGGRNKKTVAGTRVHRGSGRGRRKSQKRSCFGRVLRLLFWVIGILVLAYVSIIGILLYRQKHPGKVDFDALQDSRATSLTGVLGEGISLEQEMQALLERNEEAAEFVKDYPNREKYLGKDIDLSEDVREGEVPLLMQWDKRWGYESYGDSNIGLSGCGPTCLSMAYLYFTGDLKGNPREIARYCEENGFYTPSGTSWELWSTGAKEFGLAGAELPLDENRMKSALDEGKLIVCSMRPGDFTTVGHYILLIGYGEEGFIVNDPNRRENSEKCWTYETLKGQIRNLWEMNKAP